MAQWNQQTDQTLTEALEAQQQAVSELADLVDRQSKMIIALTIALGSFADFIDDIELRNRLEMHLRIALDQDVPDATASIVEIIFGQAPLDPP